MPSRAEFRLLLLCERLLLPGSPRVAHKCSYNLTDVIQNQVLNTLKSPSHFVFRVISPVHDSLASSPRSE